MCITASPLHRTGNVTIVFLFFKRKFIYLFLEKGEGKEKEKERSTDVREKDQFVASHMRTLCMPRLGTEPATRHVP